MKTKIKTATVFLALSISSPRVFAQYAGEEFHVASVSTPTIPTAPVAPSGFAAQVSKNAPDSSAISNASGASSATFSDPISDAFSDIEKIPFSRRFRANANSLGLDNIRAALRVRVNEGRGFAAAVAARRNMAFSRGKKALSREKMVMRENGISNSGSRSRERTVLDGKSVERFSGNTALESASSPLRLGCGNLPELTDSERARLFAPDFVYAVFAEEFFRRVSHSDFRRLNTRDRREVVAFLCWLFSNPKIFLEFNLLGPVPEVDSRSLGPPWFSDWFELFRTRENSRDGLGLRAAIALAHANACGKIPHAASSPKNVKNAPNVPAPEVVERLDWFMDSCERKIFLRDMEKASLSDLRYVLGTHFPLADLRWCQARYMQPGFSFYGADEIAKSFRLTTYRSRNSSGKHVSDVKGFYEGNPLTIETYVRYGGECTAVSRTGAAFCAAAGVPVLMLTQPLHMAYFWKSSTGMWRVGNDAFGMDFSTDQKRFIAWGGIPETALLYDQFLLDKPSAGESLFWYFLSHGELPRSARRFAFLMQSLGVAPSHLPALRELLPPHVDFGKISAADPFFEFLLEDVFSGLYGRPMILCERLLSTPFFDSTHASFQNPFSRRFRATFHGRFFRHFPGVDPRVSTHAQTRLFSRTFRVLHESAGKAFVHGDVHRKIHDGLPRVPVSQIPAVLSELELVFESLFSAAEEDFRDASQNGEKTADSRHSFSNANDGVGRGAVSGSAPRNSSASRTASSPVRGTSAPSGSAADFSSSHPAKGTAVSSAFSAGRREMAESYFSHYRFLCERHPAYKKTALRFLEKLKQRAPVFQTLHPAWSAQISSIPDFPKSSPSRPPRPKNSR